MEKHTLKEDGIAIIIGSFLVAHGLYFFQVSGFLTGGTAGLALFFNQFSDLSFGTLYFLCNLPFYVLAWRRFGKAFALNSLISGGLVSIMADQIHLFMPLESIDPLYSAITGGLLAGIGMLILFRHRSSLGGFNVLCLYIQDKTGFAAGKAQLIVDTIIISSALIYATPMVVFYSIVSVIAVSIVLSMNHKPNRYVVKYTD
ncbi:YitT family protein [Vibrio sp.]|nr:YitT family protein [Vibrio sp.]